MAAGTAIVSGTVCVVAALVHHVSQTEGAGAMKMAWFVLLIKAFIAFVITFGASWHAATAAAPKGSWPDPVIVVDGAVYALVIAVGIILDALKATPTDAAELRGVPVTEITKLPGQTIIRAPTEEAVAKQVERSRDGVLEKPAKKSKNDPAESGR